MSTGNLLYFGHNFLWHHPNLPELSLYYCISLVIFAILLRLRAMKPNKIIRNSQNRYMVKSQTIVELPGLPIFGVLPTMFSHRHDFCGLSKSWMNLYGSNWQSNIFGTRVFCVNDPILLKTLLDSKVSGHLEKFQLAYRKIFHDFVPKSLPGMPAKAWSIHRKTLNSAFTYANIKQSVSTIYKHSNQLCIDLEKDDSNYSAHVHNAILQIVTEFLTGFSTDHYLGRSGSIQLCKDITGITHYIELTALNPWRYSSFIWWFHPERKFERKNFEGLREAAEKIKLLHKPNPTSNTALDMMINEGWTHEDIVAQLGVLHMGGYDTTSSAVNSFLWVMACEQRHQMACQQEIDEVLPGFDVEITMDHVANLKYLERCVKETLRLFPSFAVGTVRHIQTKLKLSDDITLKPGDIFSFLPHVVHRNPEHYPDPEKFDPDRFLPENMKQRPIYSFLPFSAGPRNCIGWKLALVELTLLCAIVLKRFHLYTEDTRDKVAIHFGTSVRPAIVPKIEFRLRK